MLLRLKGCESALLADLTNSANDVMKIDSFPARKDIIGFMKVINGISCGYGNDRHPRSFGGSDAGKGIFDHQTFICL